jgi:hypothetical protein
VSTLTERVARQICSGGRGLDKCPACDGPAECDDHWRNFAPEAEAALREVMAALREPSDVRDCRSPGRLRHIDDFLQDFARLHHLEPPAMAEETST